MTCIVGVKEKGKVFIGADAGATGGNNILSVKNPKVFHNAEYTMGYTTSFRMGQLLQYEFKPSEPEGDLMEFLCTTFVREVRECFKKHEYATIRESVTTGGTFLLAVNGRLFEIDDDFQVGEFTDDYGAIGCGYSYALGSLHSTKKKPAKKRIEQALKAAEKFSTGVCGPFTVLESM